MPRNDLRTGDLFSEAYVSRTNGGMYMTDQIWKRDEIESPCINICVIHPSARLCTGCLRSIDEITQWSRMSAEARRAVMVDLPARQQLLTQRRGGRAGRLARDPE